MSKEKESYQKIMFWGSLLGNFMLTGLWLAVISGLLIGFASGWASRGENELLMMVLLPGAVVLFCSPGIKVKRSARIAENLMYENGENSEDDIVKSIPFIVKPLLNQTELDESALMERYASILKSYLILSPFLFAVWIYSIFQIFDLFV
nr:hypothetical protein [Jeotgalibacillus malaysiensis]